jgi:hypothetical protein
MNAHFKSTGKERAPVRPTGTKTSPGVMLERLKQRYPKTMARLAE